MSDSDLQVELDSDSELPLCNSGFHAHQESPRVLANWFFLPGSPAYQLKLAEISPEIADQCMLRANYPQSACHFLVRWKSLFHNPLDLYDTRNPTFLPSYISGWISSGRIKSRKKNINSWITWLSRNLRGTIIHNTRVTTRWRGVWFFQVWLGAMLDDLSLKLYIFSLNGYTWLHVSPFVPRKISLHNQKRIQTTPLSSAFTKCNFPLQEPKYHRIALS